MGLVRSAPLCLVWAEQRLMDTCLGMSVRRGRDGRGSAPKVVVSLGDTRFVVVSWPSDHHQTNGNATQCNSRNHVEICDMCFNIIYLMLFTEEMYICSVSKVRNASIF